MLFITNKIADCAKDVIYNPMVDETDPIPFEETSQDFPLYEFFPEWCLDYKLSTEQADAVEI